MISQLTLQCSFIIGTSIQKAALEANKLADMLKVCIEFDFNGCRCLVFPDGDPFILVDRYQEDCKNKKPTNFVSNR